MKVNYNGTVNCLDEIIKRFIKKKSGKIAVVSSLAGYIGFPYSSGYCPTKADWSVTGVQTCALPI